MPYHAHSKETAFKYPVSRSPEFCFELVCSFVLESLSFIWADHDNKFKAFLKGPSILSRISLKQLLFFIRESALVRPHETGPFSRVVLRPSTHKSRYNSMQFPDSYGRGISFILSLIPESNLQWFLINFTLLSNSSPMSSDSDAIDYTTRNLKITLRVQNLNQCPGTVLKSILAGY